MGGREGERSGADPKLALSRVSEKTAGAWRAGEGGLIVAVRATPRARTVSLTGDGDRFAARIAARPVDGAANDAVAMLLAQQFGVPKRSVRLIAGDKSREKRFLIEGDVSTLAERAASLYGTGS